MNAKLLELLQRELDELNRSLERLHRQELRLEARRTEVLDALRILLNNKSNGAD